MQSKVLKCKLCIVVIGICTLVVGSDFNMSLEHVGHVYGLFLHLIVIWKSKVANIGLHFGKETTGQKSRSQFYKLKDTYTNEYYQNF